MSTHAPRSHLHDLERLHCFISASLVVMRTNRTWAELGGLVPSAEAAKRRFRRPWIAASLRSSQ